MSSIEPFRFLHTGDLHLDSPFLGIRSVAPEWVVRALRDATVRAWEAIVELALTERVDFIVVAGDAFENANRTLRGQVAFLRGLGRLSEAGIRSFVVTGNHDPLSGWEPSLTWPALAHRFGSAEVGAVPVVRERAEIARVYGISYATRDVRDNLARRFRRHADAPFAVGLLHANVGGQPGHELYAPCSIGDLAATGIEYWALGHVHRHAVLSERDPVAVYCGNPQGRDPGEAEPRGCYLVSVNAAGQVALEFRPTDVVRWSSIEVEIGDLPSEQALADRLASRLDQEQAAADGRALVARVALGGRGPLHHALARPDVLEDLRALTQETLGRAEPFVWIESLADRTRPEVDVAALRGQASGFLAEFLREVDWTRAAIEDSAPPDDVDGDEEVAVPAGLDGAGIEEALAPLYGHPRVRRVLRLADRRPQTETLSELLARAETLVVDRLADES